MCENARIVTPKKYNEICLYLRRLFEGTSWEGYVYTVGGCCRDSLMGLPIKDVDLAVNLPDGGIALAEWLRKKRLTAGKPVTFPKYGTARLTLKRFPDVELELVQTRSEKYTDRTTRDPSVVFGTIEQDCMRRDLTINSLYYDISRDQILDLSGRGISDIENHVIRTPADPDVTFDDDPVRIIRTVRFSARYGWEIDPDAMASMKRYVDRLSIITPERMQSEFEKVLTGPRPAYALELLRHIGAIPYIMPELVPLFDLRQSEFHFGTAWEHTLSVVEKVPDDAILRLSALLHDIGKTITQKSDAKGGIRFPGHDRRCIPLIDRAMRRLRYRTPFIDRVIFLCTHHEMAKTWGPKAENMTEAALRRMQFVCYSARRMDGLLSLIDADNRSYAPQFCMPDQVPVIRKRSSETVEEGTSLFEYVMPLKISSIRRILKIAPSDSSTLERTRSELLKLIYKNPLVSAKELRAAVEKIAEEIPEESRISSRKRRKRKKKKASA